MVLIVLHGLNWQSKGKTTKGLRREKTWGQTPNKRVSEQEMICGKYQSFN